MRRLKTLGFSKDPPDKRNTTLAMLTLTAIWAPLNKTLHGTQPREIANPKPYPHHATSSVVSGLWTQKRTLKSVPVEVIKPPRGFGIGYMDARAMSTVNK